MGYKSRETLKERLKHEHDKINQCLNKAAPLALSLLATAFKDNNIEFKLVGKGLDMQLELTKGNLSSSMFLHNLFLEIATTDRDKEPLRYDFRCENPEFLLRKIFDSVNSKLRTLLPLMNGEDIGSIEKLAPHYERLRIAKLDGEKLSDEMIAKIRKGEFHGWRS